MLKKITKYFAVILITFFAASSVSFAALPTGIDNNVKFWLDTTTYDGEPNTLFTDTACTSAVANDGDAVACWVDKASGKNVTQSDAAKRPSFVSSAPIHNNHRTLQFNRSEADHMLSEALGADEWSGDYTMFIVFEQTQSGGQYESFFSNGDQNNADHYQININLDEDGDGVRDFGWFANGGANEVTSPFESQAQNELKLYAVRRGTDAGAATAKVETFADGFLKGNVDTNDGGIFEQYRININRISTNYTTSRITEVIIFEGALDDAEMKKMNAYLSVKYGKTFGPKPGGVADSLQLWLEANKGVTGGASVSSWLDQSGSALDAGNSNAGEQPDSTVNRLNFNPVVTFDGANDVLLGPTGDTGLNSDDTTIFTVFRQASDASNSYQSPFTNRTVDSNNLKGYTFYLNNNNREFWTGKNNGWDNANMGAYQKGVANITMLDATSGDGTSTKRSYENEKEIASLDNRTFFKEDTNFQPYRVGSGNIYNSGTGNTDNSYFFKGDIAEQIVYTKVLTDLDRQKVNTYLAIKYGITLNHNAAGGDDDFYIDAAGNHIYDIQGYQFRDNIIGIAKDSASDLDQRISKSVTQGLAPAVITLSTDNDFTSDNTDHTDILEDGQYLVLGARGTTADPTDVQAINHSTFKTRIKRDWRAENTGNVGVVNLKFDGFNDEWYVLRTKPGTVNNYDEGVELGQLNANGEISLTLEDGVVFTLARKPVVVTIDDVTVDEDAGTTSFTLTADEKLTGGFTLEISTNDGTAVAGSDYDAVSNQQITFAGNSGETQTVTVNIIDDTEVEARENFTLSMANASSIIVDVSDTATVYINDNDEGNHTLDPNPPAIVGPGTTTITASGSCGADFANGTVEFTTDPAGILNPDPTVANLDANGDYSNISLETVDPITADFDILIICKTPGGDPGKVITKGKFDVNEAPSITSDGGGDTADISVEENTTAVTTVTSTDPNAGDTATYSITGGADSAKFTIDPNTGVLTFITAPNYEAPTDADGNNTYIVEVTVTDMGGLTDIQTITVTVTDVNEGGGGSSGKKKGGSGGHTKYVCKDTRATNFSSAGIHKQSLCEYPRVDENFVCKDKKALNYKSEGTHKQSLCKYEDKKDEGDDGGDKTSKAKKLGFGYACPSDMWLHDNMKKGDRNGKYSSYNRGVVTEVKILQAHMNRLGFRSGPEDGIFGVLTDGAVKRMQKFLGTKQDGIVGPITRSLLNNSCKEEEKVEEPKEEKKEEAKKELADATKCPHFTTYYKSGERGGEIPKIQTFLTQQGFSVGGVDGVMGPKTISAIKSFQSKYFDDILKPWGLKKATGRWYQSTRFKANELAGCHEGVLKLDNGKILK